MSVKAGVIILKISLIISFPVVCICFFSCKEASKEPPLFKEQFAIDSLLMQKDYNNVIKAATAVLERLPVAGRPEASAFLYHALSISYKNTALFDSAVYYAEQAYRLPWRSKAKAGKARSATYLFSLYNRKRDMDRQRDMLPVIRQYAEDEALPVVIRAELLGALGAYYDNNNTGDNRDLTIFYSMQALEQNKKYLREHAATHQDSIRMAQCYLHLVAGYTHFGFSKKSEQGERYLKEAQVWTPDDRFTKAYLYNSMVLWHCFYEVDIDKALRYTDSLKYLAGMQGENIWDLLSESYILLADHYYYREIPDYALSWKYAKLAQENQVRGMNLYYNVCINWLIADLHLKDNNYKESLEYYRLAWQDRRYLTSTNHFFLQVANIRNFANLGMLDSFNIYLDKYEQYLEGFRQIQEQENVEKFKILNEGRLRSLKIKEQGLELQYGNRRLFAVILMLILVVIIALLLYFNYKNKTRTAILLNIQNQMLSELNKELKEANETKSKLFGIISHDLRSPVAQLYQLLKLQQASNIVISDEEKAALEASTRMATAHLLEGMEDILLWSKSQLQAFSVRLEAVDLYDVLNSVLQILALQVQHKSLRVENNVSKGSVVNTDANMLSAILRNLIQNAVKASPDGGVILINYFMDIATPSRCFLKIINEGMPFSQEDYIDALARSRTSGLLSGGLGFQIIEELSRKISIHVFFEEMGVDKTCCSLCFNDRFQSTLSSSG